MTVDAALLLLGDVFHRMRQLDDHSFDFICCSPPFLALRSYLPDGHPDKAKEIGSEPTPADYLDTLLALTAEWRRLLAPHGSIAVELGDTYAGSGGAGGDGGPDGLREGQQRFDGTAVKARANGDDARANRNRTRNPGNGWPLDMSLTGIPTLYAWSLAYGRNLLTGQESPAGRWRIRNLKPWIRSNPPVGSLGTKNMRERSATSYITVACTGASRWFDLDAVRTPLSENHTRGHTKNRHAAHPGTGWTSDNDAIVQNQAGAPPLDWWHHVDAIIDSVLDERAGKTSPGGNNPGRYQKMHGGADSNGDMDAGAQTVGARGVHIRRALERAGILTTLDAYDVSPKGYAGAHYAAWPPELVRLMIGEMCPRRVCRECGVPSRRIVGDATYTRTDSDRVPARLAMTDGQRLAEGVNQHHQPNGANTSVTAQRPTLGWSDCGHGDWRPGRILDPFAGSGTTLAVASGMGRDSVGIDIDQASYGLAIDRVGPLLLEVDWPAPNVGLAALDRGDGNYSEWAHMLGDQRDRITEQLGFALAWFLSGIPPIPEVVSQDAVPAVQRRGRRVVDVPGQVGMFS